MKGPWPFALSSWSQVSITMLCFSTTKVLAQTISSSLCVVYLRYFVPAPKLCSFCVFTRGAPPQLPAGSFHPSPLHFLLRLYFLFAQGSKLGPSDALSMCLRGHVWDLLDPGGCFKALIPQSIWFPAFLKPRPSSPPRATLMGRLHLDA